MKYFLIKRIIINILTVAFVFYATAPFAESASKGNKFLDKLARDSFQYFVNEVNPENGLIKDSSRPGAPCSVAAVGFGLTALCIGESRGWISKKEAYARVLQILKTFRYEIAHERGFFYHFIDMRKGRRTWNSEISSIDTALFLAGALFAGEYFKGTEAEWLAKELYERVEWPWMMNRKRVMCMGWKPETGFLWYYWDSYSEALILYALAIGSPTHPIDRDSWLAWRRAKGVYKGYEVVFSYFGSLFTYQYSQAWIDFRKLSEEDGNNFHTNSVNATLANRQFCIDNKDQYVTYDENAWGLTACIGPSGYKGYGARPGKALHDGTIAPSGMAGSLAFAGEECAKGLEYLYDNYKRFLYGKYGFKDAFNLHEGWWAEEYLAVNVGITLVMAENYRSEMVWKTFMKIKPVQKWVYKCFSNETITYGGLRPT